MSGSSSATDRVRASVRVRVSQAEAFALFTERIDDWWRRGVRFRHAGSWRGLIHLEPRLGGRLFEAFESGEPDEAGEAGGEDCIVEVGRVLAWQPPRRLVFSWRNSAFAPGQSTTVEVTFEAGEPGGPGAASSTLVTVVHRGWDGIPPDHPVRHGEPVPAFLRTMGLWWGDQLASLRLLALGDAAAR